VTDLTNQGAVLHDVVMPAVVVAGPLLVPLAPRITTREAHEPLAPVVTILPVLAGPAQAATAIVAAVFPITFRDAYHLDLGGCVLSIDR